MTSNLLYPVFAVLVTSVICVAAESKRVDREVIFAGAHHSMSEVDEKPVVTLIRGPVYPPHLLLDKVAGEVIIAFIVSVEGIPTEVQYRLATDAAFIEPGIECIKKWRFTPAKKRGEPVPCSMLVPLVFQPNGKKG